MVDVDADAHGLLAGPVDVRVDGLDTGELEKPYHESGGEHFGHYLALIKLGEDVGDGFVFGHGVLEFEFQARFQGFLHTKTSSSFSAVMITIIFSTTGRRKQVIS